MILLLFEDYYFLFHKVSTINKKLDNAMNDFEEKMKTTKNIPFNKTHVQFYL